MARTLAIISAGDGAGVVMTANGRRGGWVRLAAGAAAGMLAVRLASRLALRGLAKYCGRVPVWVFMPLECELLLWVAALDGSVFRTVAWTLHFFARST